MENCRKEYQRNYTANHAKNGGISLTKHSTAFKMSLVGEYLSTLKAGEVLISDHNLCHHLGFSRSAVRESILILASRGFVSNRQGVARVSLADPLETEEHY